MIRRLSITELIAAVISRIETATGRRCYDAVPENAESPFHIVELVGMQPNNTKTLYIDRFTLWIHSISSPQKNLSSVEVYGLIRDIEEAMTESLDLPEAFESFSQEYGGIQTIQTEETKEKHAIQIYDINVIYGMRVK